MRALFIAALLVVAYSVFAADFPKPVQESPYSWRCVGPDGAELPAESESDAFLVCQQAAEDNPGSSWFPDFGVFSFFVEPDVPPDPVDCAGTWSAWTRVPGSEGVCTSGSRTYKDSRSFTVTTSPANGGAPCPASPELRTLSEPCDDGSGLGSSDGPVLSVSPDGRWMRQNGEPVFWIGDTGWWAAQKLNNAEITQYLEDRAARGVRIIQTPIIPTIDTDPSHTGGPDDPWIVDAGGVRLNEPYFETFDHMIEESARLGINVFVAPMWGHHNDWFFPDLAQYEEAIRLVAQRYADFAHVGFMLGEYHKIRWDGKTRTDPRPLTTAEVSRLAAGFAVLRAEAHPDALVTAHGEGWMPPHEHWKNDANVDFYMHQSYHSILDVRRSVEEIQGVTNPTKPFIQSEIFYEEGSFGATKVDIRRALYSTAFGGGAGFTYGHNHIWQMADGWQGKLGAPGAVDVFDHGREIMRRIHSEENVPDQSLVVGPGSWGGRYAQALRRSDASIAWIYSDEGQNVTVRTSGLSGSGALTGRWINPRDASIGADFSVARGATVAVNPPGAPGAGNDWILELVGESPAVSVGQLAVTLRPPTENYDGTPLREPLDYIITRQAAGSAPISEDAELVEPIAGDLVRASLFNVPAAVYDATVRARDADGLESGDSATIQVTVGGGNLAITDNLVAQWDVNTRGRSDDSFYEHVNGTLETATGTPTVDTGDGSREGMAFDGSNEGYDFDITSNIDPQLPLSPYTFAVRIVSTQENDSGEYPHIFGFFNTAVTATRVHILGEPLNEDALGAHVFGGQFNYMNSAVDIADGNEHVIVQRYDGTEFTLWVDGTEVASTTGTPGTSESFDRISLGLLGGPGYVVDFEGTAFWAAIWDSDLSDAEIGELDDTENPFDVAIEVSMSFDGESDESMSVALVTAQELAGAAESDESNAVQMSAAVDVGESSEADESVSSSESVSVDSSYAGSSDESVSAALSAPGSVAGDAESDESVSSTLSAAGSFSGDAESDESVSAAQNAAVDLSEGAESDETISRISDNSVTTSEGAEGDESMAGNASLPVTVSDGAEGDESVSAAAVLVGDISEGGEGDFSVGGALQGEIAVDFEAGAVAGLGVDAAASMIVDLSMSSESDELLSAIATALGAMGGDAEGGLTVDRAVGSVITVDLAAGAESGLAMTSTLASGVSMVGAAVGELVNGALQDLEVDISEDAEAAFTASGILDSDRIVISGEVRVYNRTAIIRVRRFDRSGLV